MPSWLLILLEVACLGLVVAGVGLVWLPGALILAGLAGILACERWSASTRPTGAAGRS